MWASLALVTDWCVRLARPSPLDRAYRLRFGVPHSAVQVLLRPLRPIVKIRGLPQFASETRPAAARLTRGDRRFRWNGSGCALRGVACTSGVSPGVTHRISAWLWQAERPGPWSRVRTHEWVHGRVPGGGGVPPVGVPESLSVPTARRNCPEVGRERSLWPHLPRPGLPSHGLSQTRTTHEERPPGWVDRPCAGYSVLVAGRSVRPTARRHRPPDRA